MRLAVVSEHASLSTPTGERPDSGPARRVTELAGALAAAGHDVRVYARADADHQPGRQRLDSGVTVEHVPAGPVRKSSEAALRASARRFGEELAERWQSDHPQSDDPQSERWRPDLVHAHYWLSGLAATVASGPAALPVVLTYHEVGSVQQRHLGQDGAIPSFRADLERELGHLVGRVVTQSRSELTELARLGVPRQRMVVVPAGVDSDSFAPARPLAPREAGRRRIVAVGSAGRLDERKGFDDLIRALRHVPDTELIVVGGPPEAKLARDPQVRRLRAAASRCQVTDRVRFVGRVPRAEMPRWYRSGDVAVCASWYEPFGITALEAMAAGVPVVATAVGGQQDTVVDGVTGVLVPPHRPAALAHAIRSVLANPIVRMEYAAAGLDRARQCYAWDRVASRLDAQYRELCPSS